MMIRPLSATLSAFGFGGLRLAGKHADLDPIRREPVAVRHVVFDDFEIDDTGCCKPCATPVPRTLNQPPDAALILIERVAPISIQDSLEA